MASALLLPNNDTRIKSILVHVYVCVLPVGLLCWFVKLSKLFRGDAFSLLLSIVS